MTGHLISFNSGFFNHSNILSLTITNRSNQFCITNTARSITTANEPDSLTSGRSSEKNEPKEWLTSHPMALVKIGELQSKLVCRYLGNSEDDCHRLYIFTSLVYVIPYLCVKFELLQSVWNTPKINSPNFDALDFSSTSIVNHDLDSNTHANYKKCDKMGPNSS